MGVPLIALRGSVVHAELELFECSGEVCVNGIPAVTCPEALPSFGQSVPVSSFLVPGLNVLELAADIDAEAPSLCRRPHRRSIPPEARAVARLVRYPLAEGTFVSPEYGDILTHLEWSAAADGARTSPAVGQASLDFGPAFGRWSWQDAPALVDDPGLRLEVIGLLEQVRAALRGGDAQTLLRLLDIKFREVGSVYPGVDDEADRANLAVWIRRFAAAPERVLPLDEGSLDLRLAADGRLILPLTRQFSSAIQLRMAVDDQDGVPHGDVDVPYELTLARVGGVLRVVR